MENFIKSLQNTAKTATQYSTPARVASGYINTVSDYLKNKKPKEQPKPVAPAPTTVVGATTPKSTVIAPAQKTAPSTQSTSLQSPLAKSYIVSQMQPVSNVATSSVAPQTPTVAPQNDPQATSSRDAYIDAYKKYQDAQKENTAITEARQRYNDFVAEQAKSVAGREGRGLGIPISIVRGEQERLLKQTQPEALRLQGDVEIAQGAQKAGIESAKTGLEMQKELLGLEVDEAKSTREASKPIVVDGVAYSMQADGSLKPLTTRQQEAFNLSEGQVRYAINPTTGQYEKIATAPKTTAGGSAQKETQAERNALGFYLRGQDALDTIATIEDDIRNKGLLAQGRLEFAPNFLQSQENQVYRQLQRQFTEARLRKESGAAIPPGEYESDSKTYFAQPGDTVDTLIRKQNARNVVLESLRLSAGNAYRNYGGLPDTGVGFSPENVGPVVVTAPDGQQIEIID